MKVRIVISLFALLTFGLAFGWPWSRKVILRSTDGSRTLSYVCGSFQSQAETMNDVQILLQAAHETQYEAVKAGHNLTNIAIVDAIGKRDFKALERIVVEYRCAHDK